MAENLNEDRAYALAALAAGVEFMWNEERNKWGAAPNEGPTVWLDDFSDYHMVEDYAAAGRALGLHDRAKAILEEMAWSTPPLMDIHGRVLAAEGHVLVPREMAQEYRRIWFEPDQRKVRVEREAAERALAIFFADALGGEKEG